MNVQGLGVSSQTAVVSYKGVSLVSALVGTFHRHRIFFSDFLNYMKPKTKKPRPLLGFDS